MHVENHRIVFIPTTNMPVQQAKVKSVLSGDTLVLTAVNNPQNERTLSLAFVSAPRLRREGDEVWQEQFFSKHSLSRFHTMLHRQLDSSSDL